MSAATVEVEAPAAPKHRESHVPRDVNERPLVGLCGVRARSPRIADRPAAPGEQATCVVCREMWAAGARSRGSRARMSNQTEEV